MALRSYLLALAQSWEVEMRSCFKVVVSALAFALPAEAQVINLEQISTVRAFYEHCDPSATPEITNTVEEGYYFGACSGVTIMLYSMMDNLCELDIEVPEGYKSRLSGNYVDGRQAQQTLWNFTRDNPQYWDASIFILVLPLSNSWPCD